MGLILNGRNADYVVPAVNSSVNETMADVIGNKLDSEAGDSLYALTDELYDQFQVERQCYPNLAAPVSVVSDAVAWTYGNFVQVIPASTIVTGYHLLSVALESCNVAAGVFQLAFYKGPADDLITELRFSIAGGFFGNSFYIIGSEEVGANLQVRARLAADVGVATLGISVMYLAHV
jgi:hypothetical protein